MDHIVFNSHLAETQETLYSRDEAGNGDLTQEEVGFLLDSALFFLGHLLISSSSATYQMLRKQREGTPT